MNTTKHTPGPWRLVPTNNGDIAIRYTDGKMASYVATCHDMALCPEHGALIANAHLIAAAPDLLAALQYIVQWKGTDAWSGETARDLANAAIAKATIEE